MKRTVYSCDQCKRVLSDGKTFVEHLSINFCSGSGLYRKKGMTCPWNLITSITGIYQFCDEECLAVFFKDFLAEHSQEKKLLNFSDI